MSEPGCKLDVGSKVLWSDVRTAPTWSVEQVKDDDVIEHEQNDVSRRVVI
jgi:hypothetical protein